MNRIILLLLTGILLSCNSKSKKTILKETQSVTQKSELQKLTGKEIVTNLERLDFFNLTLSSDLIKTKNGFEKSYDELNFFEGDLKNDNMIFLDNRFYYIDCEELYEIGGFNEYFEQIKRSFDLLNLKFEFKDEKNEIKENYWKKDVEINNLKFSISGESYGNEIWAYAYYNLIEILNTTLFSQGSNERFYPINCGNDGRIVLLTDEQFKFVQKHYPNDKEHPMKMSDWKKLHGL